MTVFFQAVTTQKIHCKQSIKMLSTLTSQRKLIFSINFLQMTNLWDLSYLRSVIIDLPLDIGN